MKKKKVVILLFIFASMLYFTGCPSIEDSVNDDKTEQDDTGSDGSGTSGSGTSGSGTSGSGTSGSGTSGSGTSGSGTSGSGTSSEPIITVGNTPISGTIPESKEVWYVMSVENDYSYNIIVKDNNESSVYTAEYVQVDIYATDKTTKIQTMTNNDKTTFVADFTGNVYIRLWVDYADRTGTFTASATSGSLRKITSDTDMVDVRYSRVDMEIDSNDNIYVAYNDDTSSNNDLKLYTFLNNSWSEVGSNAATDLNGDLDLEIIGTVPYIAYRNSGNKMSVATYDGSSWSSQFDSGATGNSYNIDLEASGSNLIGAFIDNTDHISTIDGKNLTIIGERYFSSIVPLNTNYDNYITRLELSGNNGYLFVARDTQTITVNSGTLDMYTMSGGTWSFTGNSLITDIWHKDSSYDPYLFGEAFDTTIDNLDLLYIAYIKESNKTIAVKTYNGTNMTDLSLSFDFTTDATRVKIQKGLNGNIYLMAETSGSSRFYLLDGSTLSYITSLSETKVDFEIDSKGVLYIAYSDFDTNSNKVVKVQKFK